MKMLRILLLTMVLAACSRSQLLLAADQVPGKIRLLIVTGGHDFENEPFCKMFKDNPEVAFQAVEHPKAHALLKADAAKQWDVLVLYDMYQPISEEAKADFLDRLNEGKGLVVLHHAIANYQKWPEYAKIIGARYCLVRHSRWHLWFPKACEDPPRLCERRDTVGAVRTETRPRATSQRQPT